MKKLIVFVSILFVLPWSVFAAVDNVKVSGDITSEAVMRDLSLGAASSVDSSDFLTMQTRVRFDAALTEGVSGVVQLINERLWGEETTANTDVDLDLAYLQIKEFLTPAATLIIGRQNLHYGSGLIVGDPDTNQTASSDVPGVMSDLSLRKSFDAARLILDYSPYIVDLVYAKVAEGTANVDDDVTLFGFNVSYAWNSHNGLTDFYFFGSENAPNTTTQDRKSNTYVIGSRTQFTPNDHLGLSLEGAYEFGDRRNPDALVPPLSSHQHLNAYAIEAGANYKFLDAHNSKVGIFYAYLSGDDPSSKGYEGWDPMFEDQNPGEIMNILFGNSDAQLFNINGSFMPREDLTIGALYSKLFLAEKIPSSVTTTYGATTRLVGPASGNTYAIKNSNKDLGDEIDVYAIYDYTEDVQFKLTSACFIPGSWFSSVNDDTAYSFRGSVKVAF